jgi:hypothetical protein
LRCADSAMTDAVLVGVEADEHEQQDIWQAAAVRGV